MVTGFTPDGSPTGQTVSNRISQTFAVYVDAMGRRYSAPEGKPRNPADKMVSSGLTQAEAITQASVKSTLRDSAFPDATQPNIPVQRLDQATMDDGMGFGGENQDPAKAGSLAAAVEAAAQGGTGVPGAQDPLPANPSDVTGGMQYNTDGTWLEGQNPLSFGEMMQDPRLAMQTYLGSQGLDRHANAGTLQNMMSTFAPLWQIANVGNMNNGGIPEDFEMLKGSGDFIGDMMKPAGNGQYGRVNTRGLYNNIFSDDFVNYNTTLNDESNRGAGGGPQGEYQRVMDSLAAMAPYMGQTNADFLTARLNNAYYEYMGMKGKSDPMDPNTQSFLQYLQQIGAADWF